MGQLIECVFRVKRYDTGMTWEKYTLRPIRAGKRNAVNLWRYEKFHDAIGSAIGDTHYMLLDVTYKIMHAYGFDAKDGKARGDPNGRRTIKSRITRILIPKGATDIDVSLVDKLYTEEEIPVPHVVRTG